MANIGIGIIGTGSIAKTFAKCISELEHVDLIALLTKSSNRIGEIEQQFGVTVFSDMATFLDNSEMSLVCVCNESGNHGEAIKQSAMAGKHVLCEKPLEVTPEKVDEVIEICKAQNVILGCVFQNRCTSDYQALYKVVKEGTLGKLLMGNAHINWYRNKDYYALSEWRGTKQFDGGAAFINQGIHTIDLLLNVMGPVHSVFGNVQTMVHDIEGEDVGAGILNFKNGAIGTITAGTSLYPGYPERLEIYGERGSVILEAGKIKQWNVESVSPPEIVHNVNSTTGASDPTSIGHLNHKIVIQDMIDAIKENRPPMVDGKEARKSVEVIAAIYRSSEKGQQVTL
ncbi:Gfo/Idh/MocA family oxidoreductase [Maribacter algarum]|uniref:Gfo/Idh/MocA family oxidoreductase n=1 Tax=Maribacter algarum (ex Zhang et al. 2020) TaxID=2578118 RepID=A0A5S3PDR1_9FLAO|nr:Gfo/Idh/MocA family oxidoreductase [Maribacter algarum]TMM52120.1 Gfo/Idh/MocA family oxidoreductase [Maribacter algarum]